MSPRPIRVLFMASTASKGGGSLHSLIGLAKQLKERGEITPFVVLPDHGSGEELLNSAGLEYTVFRSYSAEWPLGAKKPIRARLSHFRQRLVNHCSVKTIVGFAKKKKIDLVHINTSVDEVGYWVARKTKLPFVWYVREFINEGLNLEFYRPKKQLRHMKDANAIVAISSSLAQRYKSVLGRSDIRLIHNGVDADRFRRERIPKQDDVVRFVSVGRISKLKGHYDMIQAFATLLNEGQSNFHMSFIGDCDEAFAGTVRDLGLNEYVSLCGFVDDVPSVLAQSDVYISGHPWEAFGRALAEAMISGCFAIGVDNAGTKDLIIDGETGRLYPPNDIASLTSILRECITNPVGREKIASRGMSFARGHFTIQRCAADVLSVYRDVLTHDTPKK